MNEMVDENFMHYALRLAGAQLGRVWPNPAVGAVVVNSGIVVGVGATANGGRPHAEPVALEMAGEEANGATLYVSLEPCAHHGKTLPCVDKVISSGVARVVIACVDCDERVSGKGIAALKNSGIEVVVGVCEKEAIELNRGFFKRIRNNLPHVSLKLATSLDNKMMYANGSSKWITNESARGFGHYLRSIHDAILTSTQTAIADNPSLNCRLNGLEAYSPLRVVIGNTKLSPQLSLVKENALVIPRQEILKNALEILADKGITRVLVEAGPTLSNAFMRQGLVDEVFWFFAPITIGNDGFPEHLQLDSSFVDKIKTQEPHVQKKFGDNFLNVYRINH